jgi:hypothetical protein
MRTDFYVALSLKIHITLFLSFLYISMLWWLSTGLLYVLGIMGKKFRKRIGLTMYWPYHVLALPRIEFTMYWPYHVLTLPCIPVWNRAARKGLSFVKFPILEFCKTCRHILILVDFGRKWQTLHTNTYVQLHLAVICLCILDGMCSPWGTSWGRRNSWRSKHNKSDEHEK